MPLNLSGSIITSDSADTLDESYYSGMISKSSHTSYPMELNENNWDFPNLNQNNTIEIITWNKRLIFLITLNN